MELYKVIAEIFGKVTDNIIYGFYTNSKIIFSSQLFNGVAMLIISIFLFKKIAKGELMQNRDVFIGVVFIVSYFGIYFTLYNEAYYYNMLEFLQFPRNALSYIVMGLIGETKPENVLEALQTALNATQITLDKSGGEFFTINFTQKILSVCFFLVSLVLMTTLSFIVILSTLIARIIISFFFVMVFLAFSKVTRGYFFSWLKLYISFSLYAPFGVLIGIVAMEFGKFGASVSAQMAQTKVLDLSSITGVIIGMILCIFLLLKIPNIINGIIGTHNDSTTGASGAIGFIGGVGAALATKARGFAGQASSSFAGRALNKGKEAIMQRFKGKSGEKNPLDNDSTHY